MLGERISELRRRRKMTQRQLADYLSVERSGLSLELGKMRKEGLLDFHKNQLHSHSVLLLWLIHLHLIY